MKKLSSYLPDRLGSIDQYRDVDRLKKIWDGVKSQLTAAATQVKDKGSEAFGCVLAFLQAPDLLKWTESLTEGAATVYDKAMDAEYIVTKFGGAEHRLFDGGHTVTGSWRAAREALGDDTKAQEIIGWAEAYIKDLTTTMGMPFGTTNKADFDSWVAAIAESIPGVDRKYLYDLFSFDAMELCAAGLSVVGIFFAFSKGDKEKLAEILGAMGISSVMAANPILGVVTIVVTAYSYWKHGPMDPVAAVKGGGLAAVSVVMFSIMGLPILVELAIVLVLTILLRRHIVDNERFASWLKAKIEDSLRGPKELLDLERLHSLFPLLGSR